MQYLNGRIPEILILFASVFALVFIAGAPAHAEPGAHSSGYLFLDIDGAGERAGMPGDFVLVSALDDTVVDDQESADAPDDAGLDEDNADFVDPFQDEAGVKPIADPIEPFNRAMFHFNDKLYFWVLKPAARGYSFVMPEPGRAAVKRFFTNLTTPIRFVNSILQLKFKRAGTELSRFCINTTVGVLGFMDPARDKWGIQMYREDFGQTLGRYGSGPGFFITWPIFGPSSVRDTVGLIGDFFLDPSSYLFAGSTATAIGVKAYDTVNSTSLRIGVYEDLKKDALDPYTFIRDAYHQHREHLVEE